jgi:hypothetical protein
MPFQEMIDKEAMTFFSFALFSRFLSRSSSTKSTAIVQNRIEKYIQDRAVRRLNTVHAYQNATQLNHTYYYVVTAA